MSHFSVLVLHNEEQSVEDMLLPYMENCCGQPPFEYMEFYEDEDCEIDDATGKRGYWQNPDAKWDWYTIGGRFNGMIKASYGYRGRKGEYLPGRYDQAVLADCDFSIDEVAYARAVKDWEECIDSECDNNIRMMKFWPLGKEGIKNRYGTKEAYANHEATWSTWAVITPDGEWHECGKMGWWGLSSETDKEELDWVQNFKERFIDGADPNLIATVIDCHI